MSQLTRALQKIFGSAGGTGEFGQIGSKAAGSPVTTKNLETMQDLTQYLQGMNAIVSDQGTSVLPYLEDINSLFFLTTSQLAYLMQSGVPEWNAETEYYLDVSFVIDDGKIWKDIFGTGGTPNLNFQPSANLDKWRQVTGVGDSDFSAKNLIINVASNTTATAIADSLKLLNSNNETVLVKPLDLLFDIASHLMSGTSAKNSTWYWMWTDYLGGMLLVPDIEDVTDGTTSNKLVDSGATFVTDKVSVGDIVYNTTNFDKTTVTAIDSESVLSVADNIFVSGAGYKVHMLSPTGLSDYVNPIGLVYRNGGGVFDDSGYARPQDQEPRIYNGDLSGGEWDLSCTPPATSITFAKIEAIQTFDFSQTPIWKIKLSFFAAISVVTATAVWNISGVFFSYFEAVSPTAGEIVYFLENNTTAGTGNIVCTTNNNALEWAVNAELFTTKKPLFVL